MLFKFPANLWVNFLLMNSVNPKDPVEMKNLREKGSATKLQKTQQKHLKTFSGKKNQNIGEKPF
jgi:hypothetical protein